MRKKGYVFILFAIVSVFVFGACSHDEPNYDAYTNIEFAKELLVDSWKPFIEFIDDQGNASFTVTEFQDKMARFSSNYSSYLLTHVAIKQDDGNYVLKKEIWIPTILDEEVTIENVEINDENDSIMLIIEEEGQFIDRNYGLQRKSTYILGEDGEFYLNDTTGSLGQLSFD